MRPVILIAAAAVAIIGVAAIAFAASGGGNDGSSAQASPSATPSATATPTPSPTPEPEEPTPTPPATEAPATVEPDPETPLTSEPTAGPDTPIPSEPITPATPAAPQPTMPAGRYAEPAPIDGLDIAVAESFPPQYFLHVLAGLPSGCAQQYTHSVARDGNTIQVEVLNSFPEGSPVCTAIYGQYELNIPLGSDFVSGQTYRVIVNDGAAETEFTAQ